MLGFIYIIRSQQTDDVYYGSTINNLNTRLIEHRSNYKRWLNDEYHFVSSFAIIGYEDAYIELVEEVNFKNKKELHDREGYYISSNECVNKIIVGRTQQEWYKDNKEHCKAYGLQYRDKNKDVILERQSQYRQQNKDSITDYQLQYREKNREELNKKAREAYNKKKSNQSKILNK